MAQGEARPRFKLRNAEGLPACCHLRYTAGVVETGGMRHLENARPGVKGHVFVFQQGVFAGVGDGVGGGFQVLAGRCLGAGVMCGRLALCCWGAQCLSFSLQAEGLPKTSATARVVIAASPQRPE